MNTDVGRVRKSNQDAVLHFALSDEDGQPGCYAAVVADGMGGHAAGEIASRIAVDTLRRVLTTNSAGPAARLAKSFAEANQAILDYAAEHPETEGMGTTCTAVVICANELWLAHVGDSRAYLLRGGDLWQISEDHSLHAQLIRDGMMTEEEAATTSGGNLLLQAMGSRSEFSPMAPDAGVPLSANDCILMCSDGLYNHVGRTRMAEILQDSTPREACRRLIDAANLAGGSDNISAGVLRLSDQETEKARAHSATKQDIPVAPLEQ